MKKVLLLIAIVCCTIPVSAQSSFSSFLSASQDTKYLANLGELSSLNEKWKLDFARFTTPDEENYVSDFQVFSPIDNRLLSYPPQDLAEQSQFLLGNYSLQHMNIGNLRMQTIYFFDVTGRMVDYQTNFSLWRSRK